MASRANFLRGAARSAVRASLAAGGIVAAARWGSDFSLARCEAPAPLTATSPSSSALAASARPVLSPLAQQTDFDIVVIGGGIVGMATARELLKRYPRAKVAVIEREREVAAHQSGHNSGVIHAGMYYVPGSVMAKTCVRGAALMYQYCEQAGIPHSRVGKLIVATTPEEHKQVELLFERGNKNGVPGLQVLNSAEVSAMEPAVKAHSALWSPNTGIVDYSVVTRSLARDVVESGRGDVKLAFQVEAITCDPATGKVVVSGREPGQPGPEKRVTATHVITAAGFHADKVAQLGGGAEHPKITCFRGSYWQLKEPYKGMVKTNVYPVPSGGGIPVGVHFTPTLSERRGQQVIIGPGACIAFAREGYKMRDIDLGDLWDFVTNGGLWRFALKNPSLSLGELWKDISKSAFLRDARKLVPALTDDMVEPSFTGVMAQVFEADGTAAKDYIFERKCMGGPVLHVRNAPSPACTASLAIAETVVDVAEEDWGWAAAPPGGAAPALAPAAAPKKK